MSFTEKIYVSQLAKVAAKSFQHTLGVEDTPWWKVGVALKLPAAEVAALYFLHDCPRQSWRHALEQKRY